MGRPPRSTRRALVLCCVGVLASATAQAGWMDGLLGASQPAATSARQRSWPIREFTRVDLVAREAEGGPNQQPVQLQPEALRQRLTQVRFSDRGSLSPLFSDAEVAELIVPLVQALSRAGPDDDVLLLSSSRRDSGVLAAPTAVTARLFMQGGNLQLIVRQARFEFYDQYRGTQAPPRFSFGSRTATGAVALQSAEASNPRGDWLSMPVGATVAAVSPAPAAAMPPAAGVAPVARPAPAGNADDVERRLETLKRLREKGHITEDEFQLKRKEILQSL